MCWLLTVAGPPEAIELPRRFRQFGGVGPEPDAAVVALFPRGDMCRRIGAGCACSLYRTEATDADRVRRKAARNRWSETLLRRRLAQVQDWIGLDPAVREAMAVAAEEWGRVGVFLRWADNSGRITVADRSVVFADQVRGDAAVIVPDRLVTVRATADHTGT